MAQMTAGLSLCLPARVKLDSGKQANPDRRPLLQWMSMLIFKTKQKRKALSPRLLQMRCCPGSSCVLGPWECQFTISQNYPPKTEQSRIYSPFTSSPLPLTERLPSTAACGRRKVRPAGCLFPGAVTHGCGGWMGTRGGVLKSSQDRNGPFFPSSLLVRKTKGRSTPRRGGTWAAVSPAGATT